MQDEAKEKAVEIFTMVFSMMPKSMTHTEAMTAAKSLALTVAAEIRFDCSVLTRLFWDTVINEIKKSY
jgi:hypothetical protein